MAAAFGKRGAQVQAFAPRAPQARPVDASAAPPPFVTSRAPAPFSDSLPTIRFPLVTVGLLVLLTVIYILEVRYSPLPGGGLSARTLAAYGAIEGDLIFKQGEVWRLFTASLLHASQGHLIGNGVVLAVVGFMLEPRIGPRWFLGLFVIGGLGGGIASILLNEQNIPAVGASGAIMGVLGAAFLCGASARSGPKGRKMQTWALRLILPSLIPMAADSHTDYAGHLGGVVAGLGVGVLLLMSWPRGEDRPAFGAAAAGIGALGIVIGLFSFVLFAGHAGNAAVAAASQNGLIPEEQMPTNVDVGTDKARDLLERYPHDPRAHLFRGYAFMARDHDLADAEEQLREALSTKDLLAAQLTPEFEKTVTILLAITLAYERRPTEAQAIGTPLCGFAQDQQGSFYELMQEKGICP